MQRILKFARYLPKYGWLPTILTVDQSYAAYPSIDESLMQEIPPEVKVVRTRSWDPFKLYGQFQGKTKHEVVEVGHISEKQGEGFKRFARWIRGNIFLPDARIGWVPFGSRVAQKLVKKGSFDVIMSTGPPHSSHLIGIRAKVASGLPWVVDMRDPWVELYYADQMYESRVARVIQSHLERKILGTADAVISVSEHVGQGLKRRVNMQYYETIPNGYDPADIPIQSQRSFQKGDAFIIAYVGTYNLRRHSEAFVSALQKFQAFSPVEVHLVGKVASEAFEAYQLKGISVKDIGYLPHADAIEYMRSVDMLMLSLPNVKGSQGDGNVSGKVFEYMSSSRPILAIGPKNGDLATILEEVGAGEIFDHEDHEGMFGFLQKCLNSKDSFWKINNEALVEYERPRLTERLAHLLDRL